MRMPTYLLRTSVWTSVTCNNLIAEFGWGGSRVSTSKSGMDRWLGHSWSCYIFLPYCDSSDLRFTPTEPHEIVHNIWDVLDITVPKVKRPFEIASSPIISICFKTSVHFNEWKIHGFLTEERSFTIWNLSVLESCMWNTETWPCIHTGQSNQPV